MRNSNITKEQKELILQWRSQGMRVPEIAEKMNLSESGVYRVIQMKRVLDLPIEEDSKTVNELRQRIAELEEENKNLLSDNRRLLAIIEKLIK